MGCYNYTCGISNLPIRVDEDVYMIMLLPTGYTCYGLQYNTDDNLEVFGFPIKGKYDDYGSIEEIECEDFIFSFIKEQKYLIKDYKGNSKEYIPSTIEDFVENIENIYVINEYKDIQMTGDKFEYVTKTYEGNLTYMLIHKEVYDIVIDYIYNKIPYSEKECYGNLYRSKLCKKIEKIKEQKVISEKFKECLGKDAAIDEYLLNLEKILRLTDNSSLRKSPSIIEWIGHKDVISELEINYIINHVCLFWAMHSLRIGFYALSGLGSQSEDYYIRKLVVDWSAKKINSIYEKRRKENDEHETEYDLLAETMFWYNRD